MENQVLWARGRGASAAVSGRERWCRSIRRAACEPCGRAGYDGSTRQCDKMRICGTYPFLFLARPCRLLPLRPAVVPRGRRGSASAAEKSPPRRWPSPAQDPSRRQPAVGWAAQDRPRPSHCGSEDKTGSDPNCPHSPSLDLNFVCGQLVVESTTGL